MLRSLKSITVICYHHPQLNITSGSERQVKQYSCQIVLCLHSKEDSQHPAGMICKVSRSTFTLFTRKQIIQFGSYCLCNWSSPQKRQQLQNPVRRILKHVFPWNRFSVENVCLTLCLLSVTEERAGLHFLFSQVILTGRSFLGVLFSAHIQKQKASRKFHKLYPIK